MQYRAGLSLSWVLVLLGCGSPEGEASYFSVEELLSQEGEGATMQINGRQFIRADLMSEEQKAELQDPRWWADPEDVESLAQLMREHVHTSEGYYIEAEPNFGLALRILNADDTLDSGSDGFDGREDRGVIGGDQRTQLNNSTTSVGLPIAWSESGGSGVMFAVNRLYTAAHVVHNNNPSSFGGTGWMCRDQSTSNSTNPCDGPGEAGDPRWGFGINSPSSVFNSNGIVTCGWTISVPNAWVNMTVSDLNNLWLLGRYDYARVVFSCNVGDHTGWLGRWNYSDGNLPSTGARIAGYPSRFWCPTTTPVGNAMDCPANAMTGQGTRQRSGSPTSWANLFWSAAGGVAPGTQQSAHTLGYTLDATAGQSGGPVMSHFTNSNGWTGWHIHGVNSSAGTTINRANRYTTTVKAFIEQ